MTLLERGKLCYASRQVIPRRIYVLSFVAFLFCGGRPGATHAATRYSIRFGGSDGDFPTAVIADQWATYITGYTYSTNFPGAPPRVAANQSDADVFVSKLDPNGAIVWSVVIGGSGFDYPAAIASGTDGDIYVAGRTSSTNFPTTNALQSIASAHGSAFVFKLNAAGQVAYSTYLGGNSYDGATALTVNSNSEAIVVGVTASPDFPGASGQQTNSSTGNDVFVARLGALGTNLTLSTFLRGSDHDSPSAVALDGVNDIYVAGSTMSLDFPVTAGAYRTEMNGLAGNGDAFVAKLNRTNGSPVYSTFLGISTFSPVGLAVPSGGAAFVGGTIQGPTYASPAAIGTPRPPPAVDWNHDRGFVAQLAPPGSHLWGLHTYDTSGRDSIRTLTLAQNSVRYGGNLGEHLFQGAFPDMSILGLSFGTFSACGDKLNHLFAFPPALPVVYHVAGFGPSTPRPPGVPVPSAFFEDRQRADILVNAYTTWPGVGWGPSASLSLLNTYEDRFGSNEVIYLRVDGGSVVPQLTNISVFSGTNRIATFDGAPRLLALTNLPPGPYNLIAVARSSFEGKQGTSCPLSFVVFPAPRNDSFYRATHIDGTSYVTNATNVGASAEPTEPVASSLYYATPRRSVWWCWTAPVSGSFAVEVTSEEISPQVGVFTGSNLSQLERVAATGPGSNVVTAFNATAGTHYFISVDSAYSGDFLFRLRPATPPSNDDHTNRIALTGADFAINANNVDATREPAPFFDSADSPASVWWRWTAPIGGKYILSVSSATFSPVLDVRSVSNGFSLPDYPRPRVVVSASAGQEFDLRVAGSSGGMGPFTLSISNLSAPLNDRFSNAIPLSGLPVMVNGTTLGATTEPYEPGSTVASVWYRWIAPSNCVVAVETEPRYFVVLGVYSGTSLSNLVALGDEFAPAVVFAATAGREYYFSVDDYYGDLSDFTLTVRTAQSPANDDFANAVVLTGSPVSVIGSNREATLEAGEPSYYDDSVWYRWVAPSYGPYTVSIEGGFAQLLVTPYTGSSLTNLVRATMTSRAPEQNFTGRIDAIAGFEYFLAVSSYAGAGGPFRLRIQPATPPPNDNFADRIELSGITLQITNALAHSSVESGESLSDSFAGGSVWWSWTAPESRKMVVWLSEMFNYNVQVFTGTSLTALANVAEYPSTWNQIIFDAQAGQRYAIQVSSRTQGGSTLNMAPLAQPPNDHFTNAFVLTGISASATGVGLGATREAGEPAHPYRDEGTLWWNWTAPTSGRVAISFDSGLSQIPVVVYVGESVGSLTSVTDSNLSYGRTTFLARAGETYRIAVYAQAVRPFQIFLTAPAPPPSPQLESMRRLANGTFEFQFDAIMGQTNVIDASTDLINWVPVATNFLDCGLLNVLDPTAAGFPHRFYRLRKP